MKTLQKHFPFIKTYLIAVLFSCVLLSIRLFKTNSLFYLFLIWNLFLATIPYFVALAISIRKINNLIFWIGFCSWLVFLPNSPYILTDLQHVRFSSPKSVWFDVLLILSFAVNGLIIGFASLLLMQKLLRERFSKAITSSIVYFVLFLCGFGIYMGRVLRWNSWDIINHPLKVLEDIIKRLRFPIEHSSTWGFTIGFGLFLILLYRILPLLLSDTHYKSDLKN